MKLALVTSDLVYPPREGLQAHTVGLVSELAGAGVDVLLTGYQRTPSAFDARAFDREFGILTHKLTPYGGPMLSTAVRQRRRPNVGLVDVIESFAPDVVHFDGVVAASQAPRLSDVGRVVSFVDPQSRRYFRAARPLRLRASTRATAIGVAGYMNELSLRSAHSIWHVVSSTDAAYLRYAHPGQAVEAIPGFAWPTPTNEAPTRGSGRQITIIADTRHGHLREAVIRTLVALASQPMDDIDVVVLGRAEPDSELRSVCLRANATWISWVDDYQELLRQSRVVILPDTFGTGLKNRTIDALRLGVPLAATRHALEGVPVRDNASAIVCVSPEECALRAIAVVRSPQLVDRLSVGARALYMNEYEPSRLRARWLDLYRRAMLLS